jgi:hypothetical protein
LEVHSKFYLVFSSAQTSTWRPKLNNMYANFVLLSLVPSKLFFQVCLERCFFVYNDLYWVSLSSKPIIRVSLFSKNFFFVFKEVFWSAKKFLCLQKIDLSISTNKLLLWLLSYPFPHHNTPKLPFLAAYWTFEKQSPFVDSFFTPQAGLAPSLATVTCRSCHQIVACARIIMCSNHHFRRT